MDRSQLVTYFVARAVPALVEDLEVQVDPLNVVVEAGATACVRRVDAVEIAPTLKVPRGRWRGRARRLRALADRALAARVAGGRFRGAG